MPRYYFDFRDGPHVVIDQTGREFSGQGAALQEAMLTARDAVTGIRLGLRHYGGWTLVVRDESGRVIHTVPIPKTASR
jgi:hypothetical protein